MYIIFHEGGVVEIIVATLEIEPPIVRHERYTYKKEEGSFRTHCGNIGDYDNKKDSPHKIAEGLAVENDENDYIKKQSFNTEVKSTKNEKEFVFTEAIANPSRAGNLLYHLVLPKNSYVNIDKIENYTKKELIIIRREVGQTLTATDITGNFEQVIPFVANDEAGFKKQLPEKRILPRLDY